MSIDYFVCRETVSTPQPAGRSTALYLRPVCLTMLVNWSQSLLAKSVIVGWRGLAGSSRRVMSALCIPSIHPSIHPSTVLFTREEELYGVHGDPRRSWSSPKWCSVYHNAVDLIKNHSGGGASWCTTKNIFVYNQPATKANSAFHPSVVGKWVPALTGKAKASNTGSFG